MLRFEADETLKRLNSIWTAYEPFTCIANVFTLRQAQIDGNYVKVHAVVEDMTRRGYEHVFSKICIV